MTLTAFLIGFVAGAAVWYVVMRPRQLDAHERRRREAGLTARRELPEDKGH